MFKKTGICPLDPDAINVIPEASQQASPLSISSHNRTDPESASKDTFSLLDASLPLQLSKQQLEQFKSRYENG